jgi:hypothetical protein
MADQTAIDVYERDKYSEDHSEHRDGDGDAPKGSPIEHDATLTDRWERPRRRTVLPRTALPTGSAQHQNRLFAHLSPLRL